MAISLLQELRRDAADSKVLVPALTAGLVNGLLMVVVQLSLASLIFSGPLAQFAPRAAGFTLFGGFVMSLCVALFSSFRTAICLPEDAPAAILGSVALGIAAALAGDPDPRAAFVTVGAAMALSTMGTGVLFLVLGRFRLGNLVRYMPYPVVGGFLAGVGWLLVQGGVSILSGASLSIAGLPELLTPEKLMLCAPGAALALALIVGLARIKHAAVLPGVLALSLAAFGLYLFVSGQGLADADKAGLLLGGMPKGGGLWPVLASGDLSLVRWGALMNAAPQLCTVPLVSAVSFLLICSGLETASRSDLDLRRELYLNAAANLLAGPGGSHAGYTALSFSLFGGMTGVKSRLSGICSALLVGAATFFGASLLGLVPRFLLGGLVLFLGAATLLDWAVYVRTRVTHAEYAIILAILCSIAWFGFLSGVAVGLVLAAVVFVVKYSQLPVVSRDTDAAGLSSVMQRSVPEQHILRAHADEIRVLHATGYLFFGSANTLSSRVAEHLHAAPGERPAFIVLDFSEVDGLDSSAVNSLLRTVQRCAAAGCAAVFACAPAGLPEKMAQAGGGDDDGARFEPDLDRALQWCEDAILARELAHMDGHKAADARGALFDSAVDDLLARLEQGERFEALLERLEPYLELRAAASGEVIVRQGETPDGVLLFVSGQAEEVRQEEGGAPVRLRILDAGSMEGRTGDAPDYRAPGGIVALSACSLRFLSTAAQARLEAEAPALALAFHRHFGAVLQERLSAAS